MPLSPLPSLVPELHFRRTPLTLAIGMAAALIALAVPAPALAADSYIDELLGHVRSLGQLNGQALACKEKEAATRIKSIMINRVPKTREFGDAFEQATSQAFMAARKQACPSGAVLTVSTEALAIHFPPAVAANRFENDGPDLGINPRYLLQGTNGRTLMDGEFRKQFQLITFGYTFCPDICPTTLAEMTEIMKQLGDQASQVQPLFISIDPERDTLPQLGKFLAFFDTRILGATGSPELVKRAADNFKVRYEKVSEPGADPNNYAMDHSAGMYLLAPGGQFIAKFPYGMPVAPILERIRHEIRITPQAAAGTAPQLLPPAGATPPLLAPNPAPR